jgi:hypothetical protein
MGNRIPERVTAVFDRYDLSVQMAKKLLRMDDDPDDNPILKLAIGAAKRAADTHMNNPFWEVAALNFDDTANWGSNRTRGNLESAGSSEPVPGVDIIRNTRATQDDYDTRLNNSVPDMWVYPRVELEIPDDVKLGVLKYIELIMSGPVEGVGEEKIGDWAVKYVNFVSNTDRAAFIKSTYWDQYTLRVGF